MCRLLGVVAASPDIIANLLSEELPRFTTLSQEHADGWGVAYRTADGLRSSRAIEPAHRSPAYRTMVGTVHTDLALLHLRLATPGSHRTIANTHPFVLDATAFAHNGHFSPVDALDELIEPDLLSLAAGKTDSERFFLLVLQRLRRGDDPVSALKGAAGAIRRRARFSGLNCLLLTSDSLYAYSDSDPESLVSRRRGPRFFQMSYRIAASRVVVASAGWAQPRPRWCRLDCGQVLEISRNDLRVLMH